MLCARQLPLARKCICAACRVIPIVEAISSQVAPFSPGCSDRHLLQLSELGPELGDRLEGGQGQLLVVLSPPEKRREPFRTLLAKTWSYQHGKPHRTARDNCCQGFVLHAVTCFGCSRRTQ
jgi:hypothetical protein